MVFEKANQSSSIPFYYSPVVCSQHVLHQPDLCVLRSSRIARGWKGNTDMNQSKDRMETKSLLFTTIYHVNGR
jgi:hypothetical protein